MVPVVEVALSAKSALMPAKSEEPMRIESLTSLGFRKFPPSVHSDAPPAPTQVPFTAKHPDVMSQPLAAVEVAPPKKIWSAAKSPVTSMFPANVEVPIPSTMTLAPTSKVEEALSAPWTVSPPALMVEEAAEMNPPVRVERLVTLSVSLSVVTPASKVEAPILIFPKVEVMEPESMDPVGLMAKTSVPVESTNCKKSPV